MSSASGATSDEDEADHDQGGDEDLARGKQPDRVADPRPDEVKSTAPRAMPIRKIARMIVNTYVVLPVPDASSRVQSTW